MSFPQKVAEKLCLRKKVRLISLFHNCWVHVREERDPGHALAVENPEAAIRVGYGADLPGAEWFGVGVSWTVQAHLSWGRVVYDDRQDGVDSGRGDVDVGGVERPPWDIHEVPPTVDELALVGKLSSNESWLWFVEVFLVAGEVGVDSGAAFVGDGEGHGLMPRARS